MVAVRGGEESSSRPATELQQAMLEVVKAPSEKALPAARKRSLMFAPPANRSRALFTLRVRDDDRVDLWCASEAFETFYALEPAEVDASSDPRGRRHSRPRRWPPSPTASMSSWSKPSRSTNRQRPERRVERPRLLRDDRRSRVGGRRALWLRLGGRRPDLDQTAREALPRRARVPLQAPAGQGLPRRRHRQGKGRPVTEFE